MVDVLLGIYALLFLMAALLLPVLSWMWGRWRGLILNLIAWVVGVVGWATLAAGFDVDTESDLGIMSTILAVILPVWHVVKMRQKYQTPPADQSNLQDIAKPSAEMTDSQVLPDESVESEMKNGPDNFVEGEDKTASTTGDVLHDENLRALAVTLKIEEGSSDFTKLRSKYASNFSEGEKLKKTLFILCLVMGALCAAAALYFVDSGLLFWSSVLLLGLFAFFVAVIYVMHPVDFISKASNGAKCVWCGGLRIELVRGRDDDWYWHHRKKDGTRDKRYKDNYQLGFYYSTYKCRDCGATADFIHDPSRTPAVSSKVWRGSLSKKGLGVRATADFSHH